MDLIIFVIADYVGTFAFAISGAVAAQQRRLDIFGIMVIAFATACTGGVIRDLCINEPPVGLSNWYYLALSMLAVFACIAAHRWIERLTYPVLFFDAIGLGFFSVFGAHKTWLATQNIEMAVLLGMATAVGGGMVRDVLLNRVPVILRKEIYATAALVGAGLQVLGDKLDWPLPVTASIAIVTCMLIRLLSLRFDWRLPLFSGTE